MLQPATLLALLTEDVYFHAFRQVGSPFLLVDMTTASTGQFPRVRLSLTRSATERRCTSGRRMARYEPFPSSPLKFRTVGFPQSGFKAGLSDRTFLDVALLKPSTRPSQCCSKFDLSFVRSAADIASRFRAPAYSALHTHRHAHGRFCRVTPGVLALVRCCRFRSVIA